MSGWVVVPCAFGFWCLASGLTALQPLTVGRWAALVAGAFVVLACGLATRRSRRRPFDERAFRYGVLAETVGIGGVLAGCAACRTPELIMPLIGVVVGLHFLPLARAFSDRRFVAAGLLMAGISLSAVLWSPPLRLAISGIGGGIVLWAFSLWTSLRQDPVRRERLPATEHP